MSSTGYKPAGSSGESVRHERGGDDPRVADADLEASGELRDRIEGRASRKAASELRAANILVEHLNSTGANWSAPRLQEGTEQGIDAVAEDGDRTVRMQVTTPEDTAWADLAKKAEVSRSEPNVATAVEAVRRAIERKTLFADRHEILLALDATDSPKYALQGVVNDFRAKHGTWARSVGYDAIWLVGPTASLVARLDDESSEAPHLAMARRGTVDRS